ncbi:hypothetical protein MTO96_010224 [Rhipicephalus appendiculatus]
MTAWVERSNRTLVGWSADTGGSPLSEDCGCFRPTTATSSEFLDSCLLRARVVYRDYPNSIPTGQVTCRRLSRSSEGAEPNTSQQLHDAVLEIATGQPDDRVPVALSIQTSQDRQSVVWIPVKASFVEPSSRNGIPSPVCIRVDSGNAERATDLAEWYRSRGSGQVTAYGVANRRSAAAKAPSFSGEFVPWYDPETLAGVSDVTATSLMLRDCALRSSATSKCVAFLDANERLVVDSRGSRSNRCFRDPQLLRVCEESGMVFVERRAGGSSCEGFTAISSASPGNERSPRHSRKTPFRRCVNGTAWELVLFRVDDGLLDGSTAVEKSASLLPPSIANFAFFRVPLDLNGQTGQFGNRTDRIEFCIGKRTNEFTTIDGEVHAEMSKDQAATDYNIALEHDGRHHLKSRAFLGRKNASSSGTHKG